MLLDSNIVIYALLPEHEFLRELIAKNQPTVSAITVVETLGFHSIKVAEKALLEKLFAIMEALPISSAIIDLAVSLRQQKKMGLGDSIVAATAIEHNLTLVTRNIKDFTWIADLKTLNPFDT
jgi:toxin FitB